MSVLKGEGTTVILYGSTSVPTGSRHYSGYLARPDLMGEWPTIIVVPPSDGAASAIGDICRRIARHGIAAVAPHPGGMDAFVGFVTNPAGRWSNAEQGYGMLAFGDGASSALDHAAAADLVTGVALVGPALDDGVLAALAAFRTSLLGCTAGSEGSEVERARDAAPQGEWVIYSGAAPRYWDIDHDDFVPSAAEDTSERVIGFFGEILPPKL